MSRDSLTVTVVDLEESIHNPCKGGLMPLVREILLMMVTTFLFVGMFAEGARSQSKDDLPDAYRQILPRGRIAAIMNPQFVSAEEADIPDNAWVLGVVIDGQARAYSLNLLNSHEVVNDQVGDTPFAAVW